MTPEHPDTSDELTTAVGQYVLRAVSLGRAAESVGMTRWEFEELLRDVRFHALYGPRTPSELSAEVATALRLTQE
jgi:hypothetical protein